MALKLKQSHRNGEWIVYDPLSFQSCHTHCKHRRVALKIRYLVTHKIVPTTHDPRFVVSCMRVNNDPEYEKLLQDYLNTLRCKDRV